MGNDRARPLRLPASEPLIPEHGGYRKLKSFQLAQLVYDFTKRFCDRYIDCRSRTHDQMVQAARSGAQNIAEGSKLSATSKKLELKLTNVARSSLEELRLDYEDFLRQGGLELWHRGDPRRRALVETRCSTADDVVAWVRDVGARRPDGPYGQGGRQSSSTNDATASIRPRPRRGRPRRLDEYAEPAANAALVLIGVAQALLDRQLAAQARAFEEEGGFTERLYRARKRKGNTGFS